jgi:hypothetical protein
MLKTRNFPGVDIFATGVWNGIKITGKDLDNMVSSYKAEKGVFSIPIKLGHNDKQKLLTDDMPAAGWIENVRRVGDKLVGDFMKVPETVAQLIESGAFRKRSVEINKNFKIGDNVYPLVLTGLALLGAQLPAVDTLDDIIKLYEREEIDAEEESEKYIFEDEEEESFEDMLTAFDDFVNNRVAKHFKGRPGAPVLRGLHRAFKEGLQRANKATHSRGEEMDKDKLIKLLGLEEGADDAAVEAALTKLKDGGTPAAQPSVDPADKAEMARMSSELLSLQKELATTKANTAVDAAISEGKLLPVQRDFALKFALRDEKEFKEFIDSQPKLVEVGERGTQDGKDGNYSRFEPTEVDRQAAKMTGIETDAKWRQNMMKTKASYVGVEIPESFFVKS